MIAVLMPTTQPARIDERAARVARVDRRRVLHDVLDQPAVAGPHAAAERAHDAGRNGRLQPERAAHRDHELADAQRVAVAELRIRQAARRQPHDGQVRRRIVADELGPQPVAFGRLRLQAAADRRPRGCW